MSTLAASPSRFHLRALALLLLTMSGFVLYGEPNSSIAAIPALPLVFEQNEGQFPASYDFVVRHGEGRMGLSAEGIAVALPPDQAARPLHIRWVGADSTVRPIASQPLEVRTHYLRPGQTGISDVRNFARVAYRSVLPGIDIEYYGSQNQLEFDFVVAPGASVDALRLRVEGADQLALDPEGNLRIERDGRFLLQHRPAVYQMLQGRRQPVASRYILRGDAEVGFEVDAYDPHEPLVVDPIIEVAAFFGGNGEVSIHDARTDPAGAVYAMGRSKATLLPGESLPQLRLPGISPTQIFITKISPDFSSAVFTTYISWAAPLTDESGIAPAPDGGIYFTYRTSTPFDQIPVSRPVIGSASATPALSAIQRTLLGKLAGDGASLQWYTVAGCQGHLDVPVLAVDSQSRAILAGKATCTDFPLTTGAYVGQGDAMTLGAAALIAVNADGNSLAYSLYFGGNAGETVTHLAVTSNDQPVLAGHTYSTNFPVTAGAPQSTLRGGVDAFFARFSADGKQLLAAALYGGSASDTPSSMVVDADGGVTASLDSISADLPGTGGGFQTGLGSARTALLRLNPAMTAITWATYFPGVYRISDLAVNAAGETWILGNNLNAGLPLTSQRLLSPGPWAQAYLGRLNATGSIVSFGSALPGLGVDVPRIRLLGTPGSVARILGDSYAENLPPESPGATLTPWAAGAARRGTYLMRVNLTDPTVCSFAISPAERAVSPSGGDVEFDVSAPQGCPWIVSVPWSIPAGYTLLQQQGMGAGKFRVRIGPNPSALNARTFSFNLLDDFVTIRQEPALCAEPAISPTSLGFDALGGIRSVTLTLPEGCPWTAQWNAPWFTTNLPADRRGTGSRTFSVTVGVNNFEARASSLTIAGLTLPIQQVAGACTATVTATPTSIAASGGSATIQVTPSESTCAWQASATSRVQLGAGASGTGTASFTATLPANPTNVALTETVHVAGKTLTLTQAAGACTVSLVPNATSFGSQAGQVSIRVNATGTACAWLPSTSAAWITIPSEALNAQGTGDFFATFGANTTGAARTGAITILGQTVTITQQAQATVAVRVFSGVSGVPFKANGVTYQTPYTLNLPEGTVLTLEPAAAEFVTPEHELLVFTGWNTGSGLIVSYTVPKNNSDLQLLYTPYMGVRVQVVGNAAGDGSRVTLAASTALYKTIGDWQYFARSSPGSQFVGTVTFTAIPGPASRFVRWQTDRQGESTNNPATFNLNWPIPMTARFEALAGVPSPTAVATATPAALSFQSTVGTTPTLTASASIQKISTAEVTFSAPTVVCDGSPAIPFSATASALTTPFTLTVTLITAQISSLNPAQYTNCSVRLQPTVAGGQVLVVPLTLNRISASAGQSFIQFPVDAAGYRASPLAIGSIASVFGEKLAPEIAHATSLPLPAELLGTRLLLSREGVEVSCPLFYVSPGQINFLIPDEFPVGTATLTLLRNGVRQNSSPVTLSETRPGLFAANASGAGPAAGYYVRVDGNNQQFGDLVQCPPGAPCEPVALQPPATATGEIYLVLFGTGIRYRTAAPMVDIGGVSATVVYSGPQGQFVGLDQVNIRVPLSLLGTGVKDIRLRIGNQQSNVVGVRF